MSQTEDFYNTYISSNEFKLFLSFLLQMNSRPQQTTFSFSISNILSDNFGKLINNTLNSNNHLQHQHHHHNSHQKTIKPKPINSVLFRPYDCNDSIHANLVNKNNHVNSNNSINYNNQNNVNNSVSNYHHSNNNNSNNNKKNSYNNEFTNHFRITDIFNNYNNLFNGLSAVTSYPKIHEELLNNQKRYQKLDLSTSPSLPSTSISSAASPLSPGVTTSTCTTPNRKSSGQPRITESPLTSPIPQQSQSKNGSCVDSSDDAKSECGSSKDGDNQGLWPAWVYCTRYSDRPSSGMFRIHFILYILYQSHFPLEKIPFIFVSAFLTRFDFLEFGMCRSITCVSVTHNWCTMADIWIYNYSAAIRLGLTDKLWIDFQIINNFFQFSTSSFPLHYTTIPLNKTEHFAPFITFWNCLCQRSGWSDCLLTSHDRNRLPFFYYLVLELEISDSYYTSAIRIILPQINVSFPSYNYIQISATAAHSYV